jgi:hypothetical protein
VKQVFVAQHSAEAHLVRSLLEAQGIEAEVRGEWLLGNAMEPSSFLPTVWVLNDGDFLRARALAEAYERRETPGPATGSPWRCSECGETLESQFTTCWQCGFERRRD